MPSPPTNVRLPLASVSISSLAVAYNALFLAIVIGAVAATTLARDPIWLCASIIATASAAIVLALFARRVVRARVTQPLSALAIQLRNDSRSHTPFRWQADEIGVMARAIETFRSNVEQGILEAKDWQLKATLDNIREGVELYDRAGRLVLCNARYLEMYGIVEPEAPLGGELKQLVARRVDAGLLSHEAALELMRDIDCARSGESAKDFACLLANGRCVAISVRRVPEGGFVAIHADVTEQRRNEERIAHFAHVDALTGLSNRLSFTEELERALAYSRRGELIAAHVLDLNGFRAVNEALGHRAGDRLLAMVAERLRRELRETDRVGRVGGDRFAIVERQISEPADAAALASRMIELLSAPYEIEGRQIVVGVSVGVAVSPQDGTTAAELMRNAGLALYRAKAEERGSFRFFEADMNARMHARATLERELRDALAQGAFELHFQPIVSATNNEICCVEALLRWRHRERGLVSPAEFIPLAEETRLIVPIGAWVLQQACAAAARWPEHVRIAVNLSAAQFRFGDVRQAVADALGASGLEASRLELEITESLLLDRDEKTLETLHHLRGLGVHIAMDDFGAGYSSLSYLQNFPFDKIKIDRSFVQGIGGDDCRSRKIVRAMTTLAEALGIRTTAEGVESPAQLDAVRSAGCTEIQGFLMSRPLALADMDRMLRAPSALGGPEGADIAA